MKNLLVLLLVVVAVRTQILEYPFPESYTSRCRVIQLSNQEEFSEFIQISSLKNLYGETDLKQALNTIICYKGEARLKILVSEKPEPPINGDRFVSLCKFFDYFSRKSSDLISYFFTDLNGWDQSASKMIHSSLSNVCNKVNAPSYFDSDSVNCVNLIMEDNFLDGYGRSTLYVLGKVPVCLSCFDIPGGWIDDFEYISFTTKGCNSTEAIIYYDCPELYEKVDEGDEVFTDLDGQ